MQYNVIFEGRAEASGVFKEDSLVFSWFESFPMAIQRSNWAWAFRRFTVSSTGDVGFGFGFGFGFGTFFLAPEWEEVALFCFLGARSSFTIIANGTGDSEMGESKMLSVRARESSVGDGVGGERSGLELVIAGTEVVIGEGPVTGCAWSDRTFERVGVVRSPVESGLESDMTMTSASSFRPARRELATRVGVE